ncbi:hypothetical protein K883_05316 [Mycobacterium sp. TKK-01-0059]|uniref:hypothetical protein n=1 Tax=Mycobacterium sp. TKK-01-0059 TaxID=1324269 RepID=UPI0004D7DFA6|nr:hypothetical protein [Mycobacterium sp. TKK-01-0059]KEF94892.1 hypothetical protein K883_05316 [Mycobacterium sp. TKK-01-0059]
MASGAGDPAKPTTEHSQAILGTSWPLQMASAWSAYAESFTGAANKLFPELHTQHDIRSIVAPMEGAFIDAARRLVDGRQTTLENRIEGYRYLAKRALWASGEIHATKADLVEIVNKAEEDIKAAREAAEKAKQAAAAVPGAAAAIDAQLKADIASIVAGAAGLAQARDAEGAGKIATLAADVGKWAVPYGNPTLPESGGVPGVGAPAPAAPALPAPQGGGPKVESVHNGTGLKDSPDTTQFNKGDTPQSQQQNQVQQTAFHKPDGTDQNGTNPKQAPAAPQMGSGGSNPSSVIGQMMKPISSGAGGGGSPASMGSMMSPGSAGAGNGMGNPGGMNPAGTQAGQFPNATGAGTGVGTGAGAGAGAGRAPGLAGLGSGIAETSARMATGAVSGVANGLGAAANVGHQVAQNVAAAAVPAATTVSSSAVTTPAAAAPGVGGAPMAMMPSAAAGATPVTPVSSTGPAGPVTPSTPAGGPPGGSGPPPAAAGAPNGAQVAPLAMPQQHARIQAIGADGASGELLFQQAMDAGHDVIGAMLAQTLAQGYIQTHYAVSLIYERTGGVTAWLATSEGPSSIPLGVRVPQDVRLAVTDPVVGRELWEASAAVGGINPLDVVVRHAQAREMAAPGARVLAIASSLPMQQMTDWTHQVNARAVEVNPREVSPTTNPGGHFVHRCQVAMPWEWRQANAFDEQQRLQIAARHMHMAALSGHLHGAASEKVMRLFEERKPIGEKLWAQVRQERFMALIEYEQAVGGQGHGGSEPALSLATVRAAEVIESLRHYDTAEGCADLLYATRLAGAPLSPAAAVA